VEIGKDISFGQLEKDFDAIFIGVGLGETWAMDIPGEDLVGVCGALEFIERTKVLPFAQVSVGRRIACIGAGNTAIDVVTAARRLSAEAVYLIYRRSEQEMPAFRYEYDLAKKDGVNFLWQTQPVRILGSGGVVTGPRMCAHPAGRARCAGKARSGDDSQQRASRSTWTWWCAPWGRSKPRISPRGCRESKFARTAPSATDAQHRTGNPKYFAGGDCVNGGREVVDAVAEGMAAGRGIDAWLGAAAAGSD
jgi:dihydropyrimidine dehydrogenase (NAD+) subunit PreT